MSLFRSLLINKSKSSSVDTPELYLVYNTHFLSNERIDFDVTSDMKTWLTNNRDDLIGSLKAVRKNINDSFSNYGEFFNIARVTSIDVLEFDTTGATNMSEMFVECNAVQSITGLTNFNTSSVENMYYMFGGCFELQEADCSSFNTTNVTNMCRMFTDCYALSTVYFNNVDTSSLTNIDYIFDGGLPLGVLYWATNKTTVQLLPTLEDTIGSLGSSGNTIYVPSTLVNTYKTAQYFSAWSNQIVGV